MNAHRFDPETVMSYFDGELSATEAADLTAHLHVCPDCSKLADDFLHASAALSKWQVENSHFTETLPENLRAKAARLSSGTRFPGPRFLSGALVPTVVIGIVCLLVFAIAIPNLIRSKMAANEASAVGSLRTLTTATIAYTDEHGHLPPSLESLSENNQIDRTLSSGTKAGYRFNYERVGDRYTFTAEPLDPSKSGSRRFSTDETGIILSNGRPLDGGIVTTGKLPTHIAREFVEQPRVALIARTAELSIVVKDFSAARKSLDALLHRHRGYAAQLTISGDTSSRGSLQASLRIPVSEVDTALNELKAFGTVQRESLSGEEVTMQHADLAARISNALETETRLKDILRTRTGKVADVLEVEQQISQTRGEIERMEAELKALETRVDFATISLTLSTELKEHIAELSPSAGTRIHNALVSGYRDVRESLIDVTVWILSTGPEIVLWVSVLGLPAFWIWRRWRVLQNRLRAV